MNPNLEAIRNATPEEKHVLMGLAIGRLFRLAARGEQPGDDREFANIRAIVIACSDGDESWRAAEPVASILMRHNAKFGDT